MSEADKDIKPEGCHPSEEGKDRLSLDSGSTPIEEEFRENELGSEMNVSQVHGSILREQRDPSDGYEPVPLWMVTIIMVIVFWAGLYLAGNSGGWRSDVFDPTYVSWTGVGDPADVGPPDPMVVGRRIFTQNCVVCHQSSGQGVSGQFPPLAGSEWVLSEDWHGDNHLVKVTLHGLQGLIQVRGENYNNVMPAQRLNDNQIAMVLTYIRNEWGNEAPPISEEFVAKIREESEGRTEPWTQNELQAIPAVNDDAEEKPEPDPDEDLEDGEELDDEAPEEVPDQPETEEPTETENA